MELEIEGAEGPPEVFAGFLASFPHLHHFYASDIYSLPRDTGEPLPSIPFFEGAQNFRLLPVESSLVKELQWIPRTARFSRLVVGGAMCLEENLKFLEAWIDSSCKSLKYLEIAHDWHNAGACFDLSYSISFLRPPPDHFLLQMPS